MFLTIILIVMLAAVPVVLYFVYKNLNKVKGSDTGYDPSMNPEANRAKDFVLFDDVKEGVLKLQGGHEYRLCIECGSINWNLRTEAEQDVMEASFLRLINSLNYPITLFVQTRTMDNRRIIAETEKSAIEAVNKFPSLAEYASDYINNISYLDYYLQNNKQKKKYIILSYNDAGNLKNLNDAEKRERSVDELYKRAEYIVNRLAGIDIKADVLNSKEYIELLYSSYHRTDYSDVENLLNGDYMALMVDSRRNPEDEMTDEERADWILYEAQNRIKGEIATKVMDNDERNKYLKVINNLEYLRDSVNVEA